MRQRPRTRGGQIRRGRPVVGDPMRARDVAGMAGQGRAARPESASR